MKVMLISDPNISETEPEMGRSSDGVDNMGYSSAEEEEVESLGSQEDEGSCGEKDEDEEQDTQDSETEESEHDPESIESSSEAEHLGGSHRKSTSREGDRMAAASLCVKVGSFSDPPDLPGLAHFLEHMVFMGSKNYPQENAFDEFLKVSFIRQIL